MSGRAQGHDPFNGLRAPIKEEEILCSRNLRVVSEVSSYAQSAVVAIAMPLHNHVSTLYFALESALSQTLTEGHCAVVLLDDQSTDDWRTEIADLLGHPGLILLEGHCGSAALARNAILDFIESDLPNVRWVARLDPDDLLCSSTSVDALVYAGESKEASFVLGSNHLERDRFPVKQDNIANPDILLDRKQLVQFIEAFCFGKSANELPSCNLLIRTGCGIRYPSIRSAEDHWLVAQLLFFRANEAAILPYPVYCQYSLRGQTTTKNEKIGAHRRVREELASASRTWFASRSEPGEFLGFGMEGCIWRQGEYVVKLLYPHVAKEMDFAQLAKASISAKGRIPVFQHSISESGTTFCRYRDQPLELVGTKIPVDELRGFLLNLAQANLVASNIKRENLRFSEGRLTYIDIGRDIQPYAPSRFLDSAARLYALGVLSWPDGELTRRNSTQRQHEALAELNGFAAFYDDLVRELHPLATLPNLPAPNSIFASEVTLLIKACPQDHATFREQVAHIVFQLSAPRRFAKVVVTIDPFVGKYLRQYTTGVLQALLDSAEELKISGVIDAVWVAPTEIRSIEATYAKWFEINGITATHTHSGAPLFSQLWAFGQISTRYVLQADLDVLIGRKDHDHDFLREMLEAASHPNVWCVGFNIPKKVEGFRPYASRPTGFAPEIRFGLLDLQKISANLPLPNSVCQGKLEKMWHRSMEEAQRERGMETVRGGDDRSFYVHPSNETKQVSDLEVERDLIAQGL
jgi:glycosyltransferase involved in cell wall biosynthesis